MGKRGRKEEKFRNGGREVRWKTKERGLRNYGLSWTTIIESTFCYGGIHQWGCYKLYIIKILNLIGLSNRNSLQYFRKISLSPSLSSVAQLCYKQKSLPVFLFSYLKILVHVQATAPQGHKKVSTLSSLTSCTVLSHWGGVCFECFFFFFFNSEECLPTPIANFPCLIGKNIITCHFLKGKRRKE